MFGSRLTKGGATVHGIVVDSAAVSDLIDHVGFRVSDLPASRRMYEAALAELGFSVLGEGEFDLAKAKQLHEELLGYIRQGFIKSAHDCSEGGLAVALAECCMEGVGATVELPASVLFVEIQSRIIVTCAPDDAGKVAGTVLGTTGGDTLRLGKLSWPVAELRDVWWNAIGRVMDR